MALLIGPLTAVLVAAPVVPAADAIGDAPLPAYSLVGQELTDPAQELAERYAPVLRVRTQEVPCGDGQPYLPVDVEVIMGNSGVALRGPWSTNDLVDIAPAAADLGDGLAGYHLDYPGDALSPGCDYEQWSRQITAGTEPTTYARVADDAARPDRIALQYWFFYVLNDWNNNHEGDWEMIQLVFDAADAGEALRTDPALVGYSQHSGAEEAQWGSDELEIVDGTHPVVYPSQGSQANFFGDALHLGRSADTGVGCDDTRAPHSEVRPHVDVVPTDAEAYRETHPWLAYEGRWGERHRQAFYDGPTGPNMKRQWTAPIRWAEDTWRDASVEVPLPPAVGPDVTNAFCGAVASGSGLLRAVVRNPGPALLAVAVLAAIVIAATSRTRWTDSHPYPVDRNRAWGQVVTAAGHMYAQHWRLFGSIGLVYIPVTLAATGAQWLLVEAADLQTLVGPDGDHNALTILLVILLGNTISLLAYLYVVAAVSHSVDALRHGDRPSPLSAFRAVRQRVRPIAGVAVWIVAVVAALLTPVVTAPLALIYVVRRAFAVPVVMIETTPARQALRRSRELVRGHWWRVALLLTLVIGGATVAGPLVGIGFLLASDTAFWMVNLIAGVVYVAAIPYVALVIAYQYYDLATPATPADPENVMIVPRMPAS